MNSRPTHDEYSQLESIPEIDIDEPGAEEFIGDPCISLYASLEEPYPIDPGQCVGARLCIVGAGNFLMLEAEFSGARASHCLGHVFESDFPTLDRKFGEGSPFSIPLGEMYGEGSEDRFSGSILSFSIDPLPELRVQSASRSHCFGILRYPVVDKFISAFRARLKDTSI